MAGGVVGGYGGCVLALRAIKMALLLVDPAAVYRVVLQCIEVLLRLAGVVFVAVADCGEVVGVSVVRIPPEYRIDLSQRCIKLALANQALQCGDIDVGAGGYYRGYHHR